MYAATEHPNYAHVDLYDQGLIVAAFALTFK